MPRVLLLLPEGFEEIETITPIDVLRRGGIEVVVAALAPGIHVTGRCGVTMHADLPLSAIPEGERFDALVIPGGPGVRALRDDPRVVPLVRAHAEAGRWIGAICAAPLVLRDAGLIEPGTRYTAHPSAANELPDRLPDARVVRHGRILTSRGAGTALDFGLELIEVLVSREKRAEVAASICA
jgi:4-methyl-5(b-hydroxyethyl)-thiazole monophosphate biosynthesis